MAKVTYAYSKKGQIQQPAITPLTAASGTGDDTVADVGGSFNQATLNNNFKDLATKVNALISALKSAGITL